MEEPTAVVVGGSWHVGGVGGDGVVSGRLGAHGGQARAQGAAAFHLHALAQRHLVLDAAGRPPWGRHSPLPRRRPARWPRWCWGPETLPWGAWAGSRRGGCPSGLRWGSGRPLSRCRPRPQPPPPGTRTGAPRGLLRPRGAGASWRRGSRSRGCGGAQRPRRGLPCPRPARAAPGCAASAAGTSGLRSGGLRGRGKGASGCAGGARTPHARDPYPKTTGKITPQPTIHQERQSPAEGQVAEKEPLDEPGGPPYPAGQLETGRSPRGPRTSRGRCPLLSRPDFSAAPVAADPTSGKQAAGLPASSAGRSESGS